MEIELRLFATFRQGREKKQKFNIDENTTILQILDSVNISKDDVAILLLNGMDGGFDRQLTDGDVLSVFPPVGGG